VEFLEAPLFTRLLPEFLTDEAYRELQQYLAREPEAGDIIPGTGGFRKLRWADTRRGKGSAAGGGGRSDGQEGEATQDRSETEPVPRDHVRGAGDA
jgi:hypothetical protein